ncbi:MAG: flippase-like domain-containing protein [Myxococcales bacterium]|nr:flippase-like domain-containing protein [Myxococcales bacterium]
MQPFLRRLVLALLLGVAVYGAFVLYTGYQKLGAALTSYSWWTFVGALGLASFNYGLRFLKWQYYLARLEIRGVRAVDSLLIFLSGFVLTVTPGKLGEVFKSAVLQQTHGVSAARTAPIVVAERLTDVVAIVVLVLLGSLGFAGGLPWAAAGAAAVTCGLILILWRAPLEIAIAWMERRAGVWQRLAPRLREAGESLRLLASPATLIWPTLLSLVGWGAEGVALWWILLGFGAEVSLPLAVFFYATATLAGALIPVPGGLGVAEGLLQSQFVQLGGVAPGPATASMLLIRLATLWWAVVVGFVALGILRGRYPGLLGGAQPRLAQPEL